MRDQELSETRKRLQPSAAKVGPKIQRLVNWNTDILLRSLREIVCYREAQQTPRDRPERMQAAEDRIMQSDTLVFDELADIISMPNYDAQHKKSGMDVMQQHIDEKVIEQLGDYVREIASMYRENSFHCFGKTVSGSGAS